jgi:hypothetical protein
LHGPWYLISFSTSLFFSLNLYLIQTFSYFYQFEEDSIQKNLFGFDVFDVLTSLEINY